MRANSSIPGLVVVVLAMLAGCKPPEESVTLLAPPDTVEPTEPTPEPRSRQGPTLPRSPAELEALLHQVEQFRSAQSESSPQPIDERPPSGVPSQTAVPSDAIPSPPPQKLFFQCADDVTFAVRTAGGRLEVYPPGFPNNFVALLPQPSEPGTHYYTADRAEFRFDGELATFVLGRDRWADCVSNPAAAVWQEQPRRGAR